MIFLLITVWNQAFFFFVITNLLGVALTHLLLCLAIVGLTSSTVFSLLVLAATLHFRRQRPPLAAPSSFLPPLSLLKPLHGAEPELEAHLESFFRQDYPCFEILFCARSEHDPGMMTARRVAARYPEIPVRFLSTGEPAYINAKVSSMEVMGAAAAHDIFVISDSDVHVAPSYLRDVAQPFADPTVGALTCLYRGEASEGIWAQLEATGMSIEMSSGVLVANMLEGMQFLLGPTMVTRRACVDAIGGFATLGHYCADDFMLGKLVAAQGYRIVLSRHVIDHVILSQEFLESQKHQIRWMRSTRFSRPKGHLGTSLTFALPFGVLGFFAAAALHDPALAWKLLAFSIVSRLLMALVVGIAAVEERSLLRTVFLFPIRDLLGFAYWAASYWSDVILWRGRHFRLCEDGLMEAVSLEPADTEPAVSARI